MKHRDTDSTEGNTEKTAEQRKRKSTWKSGNVATWQCGNVLISFSVSLCAFCALCVPSHILTYLRVTKYDSHPRALPPYAAHCAAHGRGYVLLLGVLYVG
jgi:hypothetical protein